MPDLHIASRRLALCAVCLTAFTAAAGCARRPPRGEAPSPAQALPGVPAAITEAQPPSPTTAPAEPAFAGRVFGSGAAHRRSIAFVCDASGSMVDKLATLRDELEKAIEGLKPIHRFSIVFFSEGSVAAFDDGALTEATPDGKRRAYKWLEDVVVKGGSDPIPALELAFKGAPDLMYLLTDGEFPNSADVLARVAELNADGRTRVNAIAFVTSREEETNGTFVRLLTTLAEQNGGKFKFVALDEIDKPGRYE